MPNGETLTIWEYFGDPTHELKPQVKEALDVINVQWPAATFDPTDTQHRIDREATRSKNPAVRSNAEAKIHSLKLAGSIYSIIHGWQGAGAPRNAREAALASKIKGHMLAYGANVPLGRRVQQMQAVQKTLRDFRDQEFMARTGRSIYDFTVGSGQVMQEVAPMLNDIAGAMSQATAAAVQSAKEYVNSLFRQGLAKRVKQRATAWSSQLPVDWQVLIKSTTGAGLKGLSNLGRHRHRRRRRGGFVDYPYPFYPYPYATEYVILDSGAEEEQDEEADEKKMGFYMKGT